MTDLSTLVGGPTRSTRPMTARGVVTRAPTSATDAMVVALLNYSPDYTFEIPAASWTPKVLTLPSVDDRCLVVFDDDGDAWVPAWIGEQALPGGANTTVPVATPPVAPNQWDRILLQTAGMAALTVPVTWELMFDGSKWVPLGGPPIHVSVATLGTTTIGTYTALTTPGPSPGPSVEVPVPGVYLVTAGAAMTGTQGAAMSYDIGATAAVDADLVTSGEGATLYTHATITRPKTLAAVTLTAKYKTLSAPTTAFFQDRWMKLEPVRLG